MHSCALIYLKSFSSFPLVLEFIIHKTLSNPQPHLSTLFLCLQNSICNNLSSLLLYTTVFFALELLFSMFPLPTYLSLPLRTFPSPTGDMEIWLVFILLVSALLAFDLKWPFHPFPRRCQSYRFIYVLQSLDDNPKLSFKWYFLPFPSKITSCPKEIALYICSGPTKIIESV